MTGESFDRLLYSNRGTTDSDPANISPRTNFESIAISSRCSIENLPNRNRRGIKNLGGEGRRKEFESLGGAAEPGTGRPLEEGCLIRRPGKNRSLLFSLGSSLLSSRDSFPIFGGFLEDEIYAGRGNRKSGECGGNGC